MSFDLQKAQDIRQGLSAVPESVAEHYEYRAVKMFPDAVDEIERLQKCCILAPDGEIFVPDGHPELERLREENEKQAKRIATLEAALEIALKSGHGLAAIAKKSFTSSENQSRQIEALKAGWIAERARTTSFCDDENSVQLRTRLFKENPKKAKEIARRQLAAEHPDLFREPTKMMADSEKEARP